MEEDEFRDLIGVTKHRAYLNFHYGVVLEEALQLAAEEEARKRHMARCFADTEDLVEEAFRQLYQKSRSELLEEFRTGARMDRRRGMNLTDLKEFTYWLHKRPHRPVGPGPRGQRHPQGHHPPGKVTIKRRGRRASAGIIWKVALRTPR